ncbi:MAG: zf-HC2 domain-containing protein [Candidatus Buchananbacteria bacterium]
MSKDLFNRTNHLLAASLKAYILEELTAKQIQDAERHLAECHDCRLKKEETKLKLIKKIANK